MVSPEASYSLRQYVDAMHAFVSILLGYSYCHSCTDFQAIMPRFGSEPGLDPVSVCGFCIDNLKSK